MERVLLSLGSNRHCERSEAISSCIEIASGARRQAEIAMTAQQAPLSPRQILAAAVEEMGAYLTNVRCSSVYRTSPMYVTDQDDFFNMAVLAVTKLDPHGLLRAIHQTEAHFGRDRRSEVPNGPRTLDIDIVYFDGGSVDDNDSSIPPEDRLVVPHPKMKERAFVLVPAVELLETERGWDPSIKSMIKGALMDLQARNIIPDCMGGSNQRVEKVC